MSLFSKIEENPECIVEDLKYWKNYLRPSTIQKVFNILIKIKERRKLSLIYPEEQDVLRIYKELKPEDVKIVILGQDPYYNGNANGYAFACKKTISPSLKQIWRAINNNYKGKGKENAKPNLQYLVNQGVMLLNTSLTVDVGKPLSHKRLGWGTLVIDTIQSLSRNNSNIIFMLWGAEARSYSTFLKNKNCILTCSHPVSASYNNSEWQCNHFKKVNQIFKDKNISLINWK